LFALLFFNETLPELEVLDTKGDLVDVLCIGFGIPFSEVRTEESLRVTVFSICSYDKNTQTFFNTQFYC
jgi:hypothetical protein